MADEYPKGFGVPGGDEFLTGRTTNNSVQTADKTDRYGTIREQATYGHVEEVTEDSFLATEEDFTNEAVEGQSGKEVVTGHNMTESNTGFATVQRTLRRIPGASTTTTTE